MKVYMLVSVAGWGICDWPTFPQKNESVPHSADSLASTFQTIPMDENRRICVVTGMAKCFELQSRGDYHTEIHCLTCFMVCNLTNHRGLTLIQTEAMNVGTSVPTAVTHQSLLSLLPFYRSTENGFTKPCCLEDCYLCFKLFHLQELCPV